MSFTSRLLAMAFKWKLLALAIVIAVIWSLTVGFVKKEKETPFITWLTTLFSVVIAALLGMCIFFWQNDRTDAKDKEQHRALIKQELKFNVDQMNRHDADRITIVLANITNRVTVLQCQLQDFCMINAIQSRLFDDEETRQLYGMVNGIEKFNGIRELLFVWLHNASANEENIKNTTEVMNLLERDILSNTVEFKRIMKIEP